ncbi:MAG: hypothetical protein Q8P02_02435 [Candidatus Micrarchaeota archaeon]|nr:hypothetical protein [Candidatus Micrarchaeota archaeon]
MREFSNAAQVFEHHFPGCVQMDPSRDGPNRRPLETEIERLSPNTSVTFGRPHYTQHPAGPPSLPGFGRQTWAATEKQTPLGATAGALRLVAAIHSAQSTYGVTIVPRVRIRIDPKSWHRSLLVEIREADVQAKGWFGRKRTLRQNEYLARRVFTHLHHLLNE